MWLVGGRYGISVLGNSPLGSRAVLANNTIVDNGPIGVQAMYTTTLAMTNTLVAGHGEGLNLRAPFSGTTSIDSSLFWNDNGDPAGAIRADPLLDSLYRPMAGSPPVDAGTALPWVDVDLLGRPRPQEGGYDIGAYERTISTIFMPLVLRGP